MVHLRAKTADLEMRSQNAHGIEAFQHTLEALIAGGPMPMTLLIKGADCNADAANKLALEQQAVEYQKWVSQATLKGQSGIYRSLQAPDMVHVRPFRNAPVQQWHGRWQALAKPKESGERERLRWEGIVQARAWEDLDPHDVMKKLRKVPQKASGPDGISYAMLKNLRVEGVTDLCNVLRRWELAGRLLDQVCPLRQRNAGRQPGSPIACQDCLGTSLG